MKKISFKKFALRNFVITFKMLIQFTKTLKILNIIYIILKI